MGQKRKQLSHAEVWDDSALLQSWDDALTEYKLYHSIHARGERVEDVIKEAVAEDKGVHVNEDDFNRVVAGMQANGISSGKLEDGELEEEPESAQAYLNSDSTERFCGPSTSESAHKKPLDNAVNQPEEPGMPNAVINGGASSKVDLATSLWATLTDVSSVNDETLKNLMMSWYYAGYYSGLYEGQQQVQSHTSKQEK